MSTNETTNEYPFYTIEFSRDGSDQNRGLEYYTDIGKALNRGHGILLEMEPGGYADLYVQDGLHRFAQLAYSWERVRLTEPVDFIDNLADEVTITE